jgi:hypothetical protein
MGYPTRFGEPESPPPRECLVPGITEVHGPEHTGPSRSRRSASPEPIDTEAPPPATVVDPSIRHSLHSRPRSSQPPANIIDVNAPPVTARSRSPSRRHQSSSRYRESRRSSRHGSYIPLTLYIQDHALHDPEEVTQSWFNLRDEVGAEAGAEAESRSRSRSPIVVAATSAGPSGHDDGRSERIVMMGKDGESRRSRSRSPPPILVSGPPETRRSRSQGPQTILVPGPTTRRRSRSR